MGVIIDLVVTVATSLAPVTSHKERAQREKKIAEKKSSVFFRHLKKLHDGVGLGVQGCGEIVKKTP